MNLQFGSTLKTLSPDRINRGRVVYSMTFRACLYPLIMHKFISVGLIRQYPKRLLNNRLLRRAACKKPKKGHCVLYLDNDFPESLVTDCASILL